MSRRRLQAAPDAPASLREGFAALRTELGIPPAFPQAVETEAREVAARGPDLTASHTDLRGTEFLTVDPPDSRDLDQALCIDRTPDGFLLRYAITDLRAWIPRGGAVEAESWTRGATIYSPDTRTPLYPPALSEDAASLLPDRDRPVVVFEIPVGGDGECGAARLYRAVIRSRRRLAYGEAGGDVIPNLHAAGEALAAAGARRGATQIDLPGQEVVPADGPPGFALALETRLPQEDWNAQVSLAANIAAARLMLAAGFGLFRVLGPADPVRVAGLTAAARALGLSVPERPGALQAVAEATGPDTLVQHVRRDARAASTGAGYVALPGAQGPPWHSAVAAPYAHATAPLRRLGDRFVLDTAVSLAEGGTPDADVQRAVPRLPEVMNRAEALADRLENACIDLVEATLLRGREGEGFTAVVTGANERGVRIQLHDPPVRAHLPDAAGLAPGDTVEVTLVAADPARRTTTFRRR